MSGLLEAEQACIPVRSGDGKALDRYVTPYLDRGERRKGILGMLRKKKETKPAQDELLASFEALCARGHYRLAMDPLEELLGRGDLDRDLREVCLARTCLHAILHDIPLDPRPLFSDLGLLSTSPSDALKMFRKKRSGGGHMMAVMERELLLGAMTCTNGDGSGDRTDNDRLEKAATDHFFRAKEAAAGLGGKWGPGTLGDYHAARCLFISGSCLKRLGVVPNTLFELSKGAEIARAGPYPPLLLSILNHICSMAESLPEAEEAMEEAKRIGRELKNLREVAVTGYLHGSLACMEGEGANGGGPNEKIRKGAEEVLKAADLLDPSSGDLTAATWRLEAAVWLIRAEYPEKGQDVLRGISKVIRGSGERELLMEMLSASVYAKLAMGDRRGGKRALLDLLYKHPVKNDVRSFNILKEAVEKQIWLRKDRDTKELFEGEIIYRIGRAVVDEIKRRAREAYPNEFGAMLRGIEHITGIEPIMEGAGGRSQFMFSLYSRFSGRSVQGEGVVHSHPSGSTRPSGADLSMFGRFPGINIIIGHPFRDDTMAAYDRLGNRVKLEIDS